MIDLPWTVIDLPWIVGVLSGRTAFSELKDDGWCPWCTHSIKEPEPAICYCCANEDLYEGIHNG